jgi:flagellar M-ring protein FliF
MNPLKFYTALARGARIGFAIGALALVLITAGMLWWVLSPREQLLFGGLEEDHAAEIVEALNEWKVPHTIVDGGTGVTVPEEMMYETRMRLVSAGIPRGGHIGFELFDDSDFGVTEFAQRVNYQRALQGEIERTIAALPAVESARVHLTIRRPGLFVGDQESSKASVAVSLVEGESLSRQQVRGIRSLIAAAVEGLAVGQVTVLDSSGALLAGSDGGKDGQGFDARDDEESRVEGRIKTRIVELLGQVLDDAAYRVSVDVVLDFDAVRQINERPLGEGSVITRKRVNSRGDTSDDAQRQSNEDVEYQHGSVREEISRAPGKIQRLSVAVILPTTLGEGEISRIESLVAAAAGIDEMRGDRLEVTRLGRGEDFVPRLDASGDALAATGRAGASREAPVRIGFDSVGLPAWSKMLLLVIVGLLLGVTVAIAIQKKPAVLTATEREAVLGKMRAWLADGNMPS